MFSIRKPEKGEIIEALLTKIDGRTIDKLELKSQNVVQTIVEDLAGAEFPITKIEK